MVVAENLSALMDRHVQRIPRLLDSPIRDAFITRFIYRTIDVKAYVLLIVDGRRDMQSLLERRLLEA